jgi:hypothetical protein
MIVIPWQARTARGAVAPLTAFFGADVFQGSSTVSAEATFCWRESLLVDDEFGNYTNVGKTIS